MSTLKLAAVVAVMGLPMLLAWLVAVAVYPLFVLFLWWDGEGNPWVDAASYVGEFGGMLWETRPVE